MDTIEHCKEHRRRRRLALVRRARGRRGVVIPEYALLLVAFGIPATLGIFAGGVKLVQIYGSVRTSVLSTSP